jgi:hypothetical protein
MKETEEEYMVRVGKFIHAGLLMAGAYQNGRLISVQRSWKEKYALLPRRTISGHWVWLTKVFERRVWRSTGFAEEPYTEYATIFEIIVDGEIPVAPN